MALRFEIEYYTEYGESLFLHYADGKKTLPLHYDGDGQWAAETDESPSLFEKYFYTVYRHGVFRRREWKYHSIKDNGCRNIRDWWQSVPRSAGVAVPVFSLRSEDGFGTGEFNDIRLLAQWAAATGMKVIQLLPVNDTTATGKWTDSYPYRAISVYALHPRFLNLPDAGVPQDYEYRKLRDELNALPFSDYERVTREKDRILRKHFPFLWKDTENSVEFMDFLKDNRIWLIPYAAFRILSAKYGTTDFSRWGKYAEYDPSEALSLTETEKEEFDYHCFVQFHLHRQLSGAKEFALGLGVYLKGDIPIGISPESTDAWVFPGLFNMDSRAGAPPDAFSAEGQNWDLPTYNWDRMRQDGYAWWKGRLKKMEEYFDLFRIDHILGFFRIWEIPCGAKSGLLGHFNPSLPYKADYLRKLGFDIFENEDTAVVSDNVLFIPAPKRKGYMYPRIAAGNTEAYRRLDARMKNVYDSLYDDFFYHRHNGFWKESAMEKLPEILSCTGMAACGEDLGMIPSCVPETLRELFVFSLEIQRMPKQEGKIFADVSGYPTMSVCSTSTHDMNPLRAWWEEDRKAMESFYKEILHGEGEAPENCEVQICRQILEMHLASPSALAIFPIQDWMSIHCGLRLCAPEEERINDPSEYPHYWKYRMPITIERLLSEEGFNADILEMVRKNGR